MILGVAGAVGGFCPVVPRWTCSIALLLAGMAGLTPLCAQGSHSGELNGVVAPEPSGFAARHETAHFVLLAREGEATHAQLEQAGQRSEGWFEDLRTVVGAERTPTVKLLVLLDGSGIGGTNVPHVDRQGRIYLYRYTEEFEDYFDSLLHEMVHAFRRATGYRYLGFVEEGLAQAIDGAILPDKVAFPLYGFSLDLVVGHFFEIDRAIPLALLRSRHRTINLPCQLQAYAERASFFGYLRDIFGMEDVLALAYGRSPGQDASFETLFGSSFTELTARWERDIRARYRKIADPERDWAEFRNSSPAQYQPMCEPGKDYE